MTKPRSDRPLLMNVPYIDEMPKIPADWKCRHRVRPGMLSYRDPMFDFVRREGEVAARMVIPGEDPDLSRALPDCRTVVEVGAQWGWWTYRAAIQLPEARIISIDPWEDSKRAQKEWLGGTSNLFEWCHNVKPWLGDRVFAFRGTSKDVASYFTSKIDFLFIDGDHNEAAEQMLDSKWAKKDTPPRARRVAAAYREG